MWRDYLARYQVAGAVVSLGKAPEEIDERVARLYGLSAADLKAL